MKEEIRAKLYELSNELSPEMKARIEHLVKMAPFYAVALAGTAIKVEAARRAR